MSKIDLTNLLNAVQTTAKLDELKIDHEYIIQSFKYQETQFGKKLCVIIEGKTYYLPTRYDKVFTKQQVASINEGDSDYRVYLTYKGKRTYGKDQSSFILEFNCKKIE